MMFAIKKHLSFGIAGLGPLGMFPLPRIKVSIIGLEIPAAAESLFPYWYWGTASETWHVGRQVF